MIIFCKNKKNSNSKSRVYIKNYFLTIYFDGRKKDYSLLKLTELMFFISILMTCLMTNAGNKPHNSTYGKVRRMDNSLIRVIRFPIFVIAWNRKIICPKKEWSTYPSQLPVPHKGLVPLLMAYQKKCVLIFVVVIILAEHRLCIIYQVLNIFLILSTLCSKRTGYWPYFLSIHIARLSKLTRIYVMECFSKRRIPHGLYKVNIFIQGDSSKQNNELELSCAKLSSCLG